MRTPETLTAVQRAAQLKQIAAASPTVSNSTDGPIHSNRDLELNKKDDRYKEQARNALFTPTSRNATADLDPRAEVDGSVSRLSIDDLEPYEYNPRTRPNPLYEEIKASIKADGITNILTVTRRPGATKYSPYGGGNTRLAIAKELYAEGDQRFKTLTVVVKAWPGDAGVISAHLAENENRGDISLWEKALGVAAFKRELEADRKEILSTGDLNNELKKVGLNFGNKVIQNFAFAIEHLAPIGPWLRTDDLNMVIRPAVGSYIAIAQKLSATSAIQEAILQVLKSYATELTALEAANKDADAQDRRPVVLDAKALIEDLETAVAQALQVDPSQVPVMASALAQNSRISADDLRKIRITSTAPEAANRKLPFAPASPPTQRPLAGMLAGVPPVPGNRSGGVGQDDDVQDGAGTGRGADAGQSQSLDARQDAQIHECLMAINEVVPMYDFVKSMAGLPFGFFVDFPESIDKIEGTELASHLPELRSMLWKLLAMLSGQINEVIAQRIPIDPSSLWERARADGEEAFRATCMDRVQAIFAKGEIFISGYELSTLLTHQDVGPVGALVNRLLQTMNSIRTANPQRFAYEFQVMFS